MNKKRILKCGVPVLLTLVLILGLTACAADTNSSAEAPAPVEDAPAPVEEVANTDPIIEEVANTDPIIIVYYPNESAGVWEDARNAFGDIITAATGRPVEHMLTTDYIIAIEAIAQGTADLAYMGPTGYLIANEINPAVIPLVVNTGASGTLDDAVYFGWFAVLVENADDFRGADGEFDFDLIEGRSMTFVTPTSTSGFVIPMGAIAEHFGEDRISDDYILDGDFFSDVQMGGSHQGSTMNLLMGATEIAAFADTVLAPYIELVSGEHNAAGAVYRIVDGVEPPFHTHIGVEFILIESVPVLNPPWAVNTNNFTQDEIDAMRALLIDDSTTNNQLIFGSEDFDGHPWFPRTAYERFVVIEDSWFDAMR